MNNPPIIFISYNSSSSQIADDMANQLCEIATVRRYESDVKPAESIEKYMQSIEMADFVIAIISSNYLESTGCMYEGILAVNSLRTIYFVVENDAAKKIYERNKRFEITEWWVNEEHSFRRRVESLPLSTRGGFQRELNRLAFIRDHSAEFLDKIGDIKGTSSYKAVMEIKDVIQHARFDSTEADIRNAILSILHDNIPEQEKIYYNVNKAGSLSRADLEPVIKKKRSATLQVLNSMVDSGILTRTGKGPQVKYTVYDIMSA